MEVNYDEMLQDLSSDEEKEKIKKVKLNYKRIIILKFKKEQIV